MSDPPAHCCFLLFLYCNVCDLLTHFLLFSKFRKTLLTFFRSKTTKSPSGKHSRKGKKVVVLPITTPAPTQPVNTTPTEPVIPVPPPTLTPAPAPTPIPAPAPTGSFSLLDENEINDEEDIEQYFFKSATQLRKRSKEPGQPSSPVYTATVQTVPPSPPTEESLQTQPTKEPEQIENVENSKKLSSILKTYLGENYLSKVQDVDINLIQQGKFIFFNFDPFRYMERC